MPLILATAAVVGIAVIVFGVVRLLNGSGETSATAAAPLSSASSTSSPSSPAATSSTTTAGTPSPTSTASATSTTSTTSTTSATSAADLAAMKALQECTTRQTAAKPVMDAVTAGVRDWTAHLQGQADIDSSAKTYIDVKTNVFAPTRAAGPGEVSAYDAAMATYTGVGGCQDVGGLQASAALMPKLQACATREQAVDAYVDKAEAVMNDWRTHLQEMGDHTDGHLNGPDAQARWIERYKAAPTNLNPYNDAKAALAAVPACTV